MKTQRRLRRFFSSSPLRPGEEVSISASQTHHLKDTLRLKVEDRCLVIDGSGREAEARVRHFSKDGQAQLMVEKMRRDTHLAQPKKVLLRVAFALPQKGKADDLIRKAQELGLYEIWPIETERTIVKIGGSKQVKVLERWQKISEEAAKQSGSLDLVKIALPKSFRKAFSEIPSEQTVIIFHPHPEAEPFAKWVRKMEGEMPSDRILNLFFGPEGGFAEEEIEWAQAERERQGTSPPTIISLGENILKSDTAFLSVTGALRLLLS